MSDPAKPSDEDQPTAPADASPSPAPSETTPLDVMPDAAPLPAGSSSPTGQTPPGQPPAPGQPGQSLAVIPPADATKPPVPVLTPIDYAMPQSKSFIPTPALIKNVGCIIKMLFGFTVLLVLGYVMLMALNPKARQWALQGSQPGADGSAPTGRGPTPFKAVNQVLAIPAQALGKTDDVVKANNARAGLLDGMIAQEEGKMQGGATGGGSRPGYNPFATEAAKTGPAGQAGKPGEPLTPEDERAANAARLLALQEKMAIAAANGELPPAAPVNAVRPTAIVQTPEALAPVTLPGGIVIRPASPAGAPPPTRTFFYWILNLNIGAINPPRLLINGRLVHEQQEVSIPLGITFDHFDTEQRLLIFHDNTGAVVTRSY